MAAASRPCDTDLTVSETYFDILGRVCKFRVLSRSQKTRFIREEKDGGVHCLSHGRCGFEEGTVTESVCGSR